MRNTERHAYSEREETAGTKYAERAAREGVRRGSGERGGPGAEGCRIFKLRGVTLLENLTKGRGSSEITDGGAACKADGKVLQNQ